MKLLKYDVPIGVSLHPLNHLPLIDDYIESGFTHFEYQIPVDRSGIRGAAKDILAAHETLNRALAAHGVYPWSVHLPFMPGWDPSSLNEDERRGTVEAMADILRISAEWGVRVATIHATCPEPVSQETRHLHLLRVVRSLCELRDFAALWNVRIAVENLPRTCMGNNSVELTDLIEAVNGIGCCFDVNHLLSETHAEFMAHAARSVITTHLSDYDGIDERHWLPNRGIVPFGAVMEGLQQSGYRGPYLFELGLNEEGRGFTGREIIEAFRASLAKR